MKNIELRRDYASSNPRCELCPTINKLVGFRCNGERGVECHHCLASGTGGRWDVVANLLCVCEPAHRFCHEHPKEGRIASLAVKVKKHEFDEQVIFEASGQHLIGWLENQVENGGLLEGFCLLARDTLAVMKGSLE